MTILLLKLKWKLNACLNIYLTISQLIKNFFATFIFITKTNFITL